MAKNLSPINEISLHYKRPHITKLPKLIYSSDVVDYLFTIIDTDTLDLKEYCWIALLTYNDHLLGISEISSGSIRECSMSIREIIQLSLVTNAAKIVVIHNHPSGNTEPSKSDIRMTKELNQATRLFHIMLADHIILTSETYTSMRRENLI
jgi:DNA repair protein RadC